MTLRSLGPNTKTRENTKALETGPSEWSERCRCTSVQYVRVWPWKPPPPPSAGLQIGANQIGPQTTTSGENASLNGERDMMDPL